MRSLIVPLLGQGVVVGGQPGTIRMDAGKQWLRFPAAMPPHQLYNVERRTSDDLTHGDASSVGQADVPIGSDPPEHPPPEVSHVAVSVVPRSRLFALVRVGNRHLLPPARSVRREGACGEGQKSQRNMGEMAMR